MKKLSTLLFALTVVLISACRQDAALGRPADSCCRLEKGKVEIVVPNGAARAVDFAAEELGKFLGKSLGGEIPRVSSPAKGRVSIILGDNALARDAGVSCSRLPRDGFRILVETNRIYIAGRDDPNDDIRRILDTAGLGELKNHEHATLFGVYDFLERFVGVRFYFPDDDLGVIVPKKAVACVPKADLTDTPRNTIRTVYYGPAVWLDGSATSQAAKRAYGLMWLRNRLGTFAIPCCHGQNGFRFNERFAKTHPEYFQMRKDGTRNLECSDRATYDSRQLCHSSAVWDEIYADAKAYLLGQSAETRGVPSADHPGQFAWNRNCQYGKYVDVMPQDSMVECHCAQCQSAYRKDETHYATELIWGNTKRLAERLIAEKVPGYVVQMAYAQYRRVPPFPLATNILVMVAENGPWSTGDAAAWTRDKSTIEDWAKAVGRKVWTWNYPGQWGKFARPGIAAMAPHAYDKFYKSVADLIFGAFAESETERIIYNYLNHYVFGKLMWDPSADVDALLDEHHRMMFGEAADEMKTFYEELEEKWVKGIASAKPNRGCSVYEFPSDIVQWQQVYSAEVLRSWSALFAKAAKKLAPDSDESKRLALVKREFLDPLIAGLAKFEDESSVETALQRRSEGPNRSILVNGDFNGLDGWVGGVFDTNVCVTGRGSLRLDCTGKGNVSCGQTLGRKLERNTRYRLSYFVKQTGFEKPGALSQVHDAGGETFNKCWLLNPRFAPTDAHDWTACSYEFTTGSRPDAEGKSAFSFVLTGRGTAWFDDVRIEKIEKVKE